MPKPDSTPNKSRNEEAKSSTEEATVSKPGGFKNDPDDAKNPNEEIERHRRKVRPNGPA